ncbi:hypothetical protein K501DRAFT_313884 [Backusella circina FSU 941]|nr:hypothetical protein K501DRAFT_313884 [Backusella circina FSU 941]
MKFSVVLAITLLTSAVLAAPCNDHYHNRDLEYTDGGYYDEDGDFREYNDDNDYDSDYDSDNDHDHDYDNDYDNDYNNDIDYDNDYYNDEDRYYNDEDHYYNDEDRYYNDEDRWEDNTNWEDNANREDNSNREFNSNIEDYSNHEANYRHDKSKTIFQNIRTGEDGSPEHHDGGLLGGLLGTGLLEKGILNSEEHVTNVHNSANID